MEKDQYVAYNSHGIDGQPVRRIFSFSILEEKTAFLAKVRQCTSQMQTSSEKSLIRDTLVSIVQDDKFLDYFI